MESSGIAGRVPWPAGTVSTGYRLKPSASTYFQTGLPPTLVL